MFVKINLSFLLKVFVTGDVSGFTGCGLIIDSMPSAMPSARPSLYSWLRLQSVITQHISKKVDWHVQYIKPTGPCVRPMLCVIGVLVIII